MKLNESYFDSEEYKAKMAQEQAEQEAYKAKAAASLRDDMMAKARRIGISERAIDVVFSEPKETEASIAARGCSDMLVLSGGPGCGKTIAAALWATDEVRDSACWKYSDMVGGVYGSYGNQFLKKPPLWMTAAKLARWERYDEDKMNELLRVRRLVVDDLGGEFMDKAGFYASLLDELVNERQAASRPTIFTTNLDADAFKARYGERITDRIREGGRFIGCGNASLRRRPEQKGTP